MIEPVVLKGFRDSLPKDEIPKKKIIRKLEDVFTSFGFSPIDTPVLEYTDVLLGKGGGETDKQIFRFKDNGGRDVAMRFDLTVPFARFMAAHHSEVGVPFKRYHISKVWRGENPQKGRYREFIQCDFDIVGADNTLSDVEILSMMHASFAALGIERYTFHISHRGLFSLFLASIGIEDKSIEVLRTVDKLRKIGEDEVRKLLTEITGDEGKANAVISYITAGDGKDFMATLETLEELSGGKSEPSSRMREIHNVLTQGIVYETFLDDLPSIGSVCSGGRYNDLASLYMKEKTPGVGSSIGLDRLLAALEELQSPLLKDTAEADIMIVPQSGKEGEALKTASMLRQRGLNVSMYLIPDAKMKKIYAAAETAKVPYLLTFGESSFTVKNLNTRESMEGEEAINQILKEREN